jgi:Carbohydrate family 9 binding domain-like
MDTALKRSVRRSLTLRLRQGRTLAGGCLFTLAFGGLQAAELPLVQPHAERDFSTYQPTGKATRIAPNEAPIIDGDLTDPIWSKAQAIDEFYQLDPDTGDPGSEPTVVRFLYDDNNLYVGIYAYDRDPGSIVATNKSRDGMLGVDDTVRIYLDPQNTRRNSYYFEMNALGARVDALIQNNTDYIKEWNTIWTGRGMRTENGFSVEMAIPFRDLSYDPSKPDWVLEISRNIRRKGERIRWGAINAATQFSDITNSGTLTGITGINQGLGLDIQLFGSLRYRFDWQQPKREIVSFRASGNAFYKLTPLLTGTLTVNPDFSDAPLDVLQVNTTRFALFQPETRDFFLQDVATFEFGGRGFTSGFNYYYSTDNAQPFFSRNIGLANGLPVSIVSGGKLSGEYAGFGIGALSVITNGTGTGKANQVLSVVRVTRPIGESKAGLIVTNGDPSGASKNTIAGIDYQFRDSNWTPGKILQSDFYYQRSFSTTHGDDDSFGIAPTYPNEPLGGEAHFKQVGRNFSPALGFVNRTGIRQYDGKAQYRRRDLGWRWLDISTSWYVVTGLNNHLESRENGLLAGVSLRTTDEVYMRVVDDFEAVPVPFKIAGRVPVPAGRYHWTNINPTFRTSEGRPFFVRGDIQCCSYYNGDYFRIDLQSDFRPNPLFQISPHYTYTYVSLPTGLVNIHQLATDFRVNFTPDMQLLAQLQYDNISEKFALSLRYKWEYEPGQELFASVGQSAVIPGEPTFVPQSTQVSLRLGHTFRF